MALTTAQQTQATQLSNAVPWVYPSVSDAGFWDNYFSGSGPSLTPAEQASGISLGPMTPSPAPQPQVLPGFNPDFVGPQLPPITTMPETPPVPYQSALIQSLRAASPGFTSNNPGVTMLANPANSSTVIDFQRTVRPGLLPPPAPAPAPVAPPAPAPAPVSGGGGGGGGGSPPGGGVGPITIGPGPITVGPAPDDDFVGPMPDDFVGPMPDDFVGPPAPDEDATQTFPVPDPAPPDVRDLPPLPGEADPDPNDDFVGPMPDDFVGPLPDDFVGPMPDDFVGPMPDDFVGPPAPEPVDPPQGEIDVGPPGDSQPARDAIDQIGDITEVGDPLDELGEIILPDDFVGPLPFIPSDDDFVGPPAPDYDEIPQGEIEVGPPGSSQPARDAIDQIGDITEVGDPLDELGDIEIEIPDILPPDIPLPEPDTPDDAGGPAGGSGDFYVPPRDLMSVSPDPLDEWDWIELEEPEIPLPEIPAANFGDFSFSDAELMDMLFGDFGFGGGGGGAMPFSDMVVLSQK